MTLHSQEPIETISKSTTALAPATAAAPISPTTKKLLSGINANVIEVAAAARAKLNAVVTASSALQILNQDYIQICKPNAIVRPVRRVEPPQDGLPVHDLSKNLPDNDKENKPKKKPDDEFTRELDTKLKKLQKDSSSKSSSKNGSNQDSLNNRPIFITTVPKGVFLEPVKELPAVQTRRIYAFASRPRILQTSKGSNSKEKYETHRSDKDTLPPSINGVKQSHWGKISIFLTPVLDEGSKGRIVFAQKYELEFLTGDGFLPPIAPKTYKIREQHAEPLKNVMYDRRVVRGSNYNQHLTSEWNPYFAYAGLLSGKQGDGDTLSKEAEARRRQVLRKRAMKNQRGIIGTPPPVYGRKHENVQTDKYLEELFDKPVEVDTSAQTDLFLQRPPSPPYIPSKVGVDVATEILDGDLFDFDIEVQPILETLVGHSVEQGLIEVMHEEEIAEMKKQQQEFLALREADLAELRRLEAEEIRLQAERDRRIRQDEISKSLDAEMKEKVTAAKLLRGHIADLIPGVLADLEPLQKAENREELESKLCPWLTEEVAQEVGLMVDSREMLTEIIKEILKERSEAYKNLNAPKEVEEEAIPDEETETETETEKQ